MADFENQRVEVTEIPEHLLEDTYLERLLKAPLALKMAGVVFVVLVCLPLAAVIFLRADSDRVYVEWTEEERKAYYEELKEEEKWREEQAKKYLAEIARQDRIDAAASRKQPRARKVDESSEYEAEDPDHGEVYAAVDQFFKRIIRTLVDQGGGAGQ